MACRVIIAPCIADDYLLGGADALSAKPFVRLLALAGTGVAVWWTDGSVSHSREVKAGRGVRIVANRLQCSHIHTTLVAITSRGWRHTMLLCGISHHDRTSHW